MLASQGPDRQTDRQVDRLKITYLSRFTDNVSKSGTDRQTVDRETKDSQSVERQTKDRQTDSGDTDKQTNNNIFV